MVIASPPHSTRRSGSLGATSLVGATLLGSILAATGLVTAYLTIATPFVANLAPAGPGGGMAIGLGIWSFALIAGGGLLVSGTNRLAVALATLQRGRVVGGPAARALASWADEIAVAGDVQIDEGPAIPELAIGAFGVAAVHALPSAKQVRHGPAGWEVRSSDGWNPIEDPLDAARRDADRVRRWLSTADLDFVVRVYTALVVDDRSIERAPTCAVLSAQQIPGWVASLPRQRTLTAGRRERLLALALKPPPSSTGRRRTSW